MKKTGLYVLVATLYIWNCSKYLTVKYFKRRLKENSKNQIVQLIIIGRLVELAIHPLISWSPHNIKITHMYQSQLR